MKKAVEPMTIENAIIGLVFRASQTRIAKRTETTAKNQMPFLWKNCSPAKPYFFGSTNNQWKKRKTKKVPPPPRRIGAEDSMASFTLGSLLKVAVSEPKNPKEGLTANTMIHGNKPRTTNTAKINPQSKNHLRDFWLMVDKTSALTIALSMELMISNKQRPRTVKTIAIIIEIQFKLLLI